MHFYRRASACRCAPGERREDRYKDAERHRRGAVAAQARGCRHLDRLAEAKAIELRLGRVEPAPVLGQEQALHTLARNLIDNALRYTPNRGRVSVETWSDERGTLIRVSDTGPGVPAEERSRVFDRFYRLPGSAAEGSGLGLAIVKQIADAHRAEITLGETATGQGLTASVRFPPVAEAHPRP